MRRPKVARNLKGQASNFSKPKKKEKEYGEGMKILLVDECMDSLDTLKLMLKSCKYNVTCCNSGAEALDRLQKRKAKFELVMMEVHMQEMDGLHLLKAIINLKKDIPVVIISSDETTETVVKVIKAGATDYLAKPSSLATFRNIWQHAYRKELASKKKGRRNEDADGEKLRLKWTHNLHQKFSYAVNILGLDKAVPKKILELMNIPNLTKEHVASHLQKFRKYLKTRGCQHSTKMTPEMLAAVSARISSGMELGECSGAQNGPVMPGHPFNQQPPYILTGQPPSTFPVANPLQPWANFQPPTNLALNQPVSNYTVHNPVVMSQAENTPMPILRGSSGLGEGTLTGQGQASNLDFASQHAHNVTDGAGSDIGFCNDEDMGDFLSSLLNSPKEDHGPGHKEDQGQGPKDEQEPGTANLEE